MTGRPAARGRRVRICATLAALALVVSTVPVSPTAHAGDLITSTASLPFSGAFFDSVTGETVDISGYLHIVTQTAIPSTADTLTLFSNLPADVDAIGRTSGLRYILNGAHHSQCASSPPAPPPTSGPPLLRQVIFPPVPLIPANVDILFMRVQLSFASDGTLLADGSRVFLCGDRIGSCNID